jgi:sulfur carrier protein
MNIQINNEQRVVPEGSTVQEVVISLLQLNPSGMAIAINDSIVPRHLWESSQLQTNDRMLVIKAASGG